MSRIDPDIDIVSDLLKAVLLARPDDVFCKSLLQQYHERGGLSKKQLEGLLGKATKFTEAPVGKLATLEAIILKKHTRHRSDKPTAVAQEEADLESPLIIDAILHKYPGHKRVLFFKMKLEKKDPLNQAEKEELARFAKILLK